MRFSGWPYAVLLAEVLAFYRQVLFYGHFAIPWDLRYYHLPLAWAVARSFRRGELPLWDPYTYCGMPMYANLQTQLFYPPTILTILLSNWTGGKHLLYFLELQLIGHVFLGGVLAYWLLRRLELRRAAALIGATVFQLGAFFASQTEHLGAIDAAAWLPLAWLGVIVLGDRFRWRWLAGLAFALAMAFLAGFPAVTAVVFGSCFWLAAILVLRRSASPMLLSHVALASAWAAVVSAIQLLPALELTRLSVASLRSKWLQTGGGLPLQSLVSLVAPNYYGVFDFNGNTWSKPWDVTFLYLYCGIPALLLNLYAVAFQRSKQATVFALLTALSAFWMLGASTPAGRAVSLLLPPAIKSPLYAEFAMCSFVLGLAVLGALGADHFLHGRGHGLQAALVALVAVDLIAVGSGRPMNTTDERQEPGIAYEHFDGVTIIPGRLRELVNRTVPLGLTH